MQITSIINVLNKFDRGWAEVNLLDGGRVLLPYGTTFGFIQDDLLMVLDGHYKGDSIKLTKESYLLQSLGYQQVLTNNQITIKYNLEDNRIVFQDGNSYVLVRSSQRILSPGNYKLELPRFPHRELCKSIYLDESIGGSRFAETWFEIVPAQGKRIGSFLHYGKISEGCLTISMKENPKNIWTDIYFSLITNRVQSNFVANLIVG